MSEQDKRFENKPDSIFDKIWRGVVPYRDMFWLYWILPLLAFPIIIKIAAVLVASISAILAGLVLFGSIFLLFCYNILCFIGVWKSANRYTGKKTWAILGKLVVILCICSFSYSIFSMVFSRCDDKTHDSNRIAEINATPTIEYPLAGFWKENMNHNFGLAIGPNDDGTYYISFCGPGGCFKPGTYLPNSTIINDKNWEVIDTDTIVFKKTKSTYKRTPSNKR